MLAATLPSVAELGSDPRPGQRVTAVGYPLGGELTLSRGRVIGYLDEEVYLDKPNARAAPNAIGQMAAEASRRRVGRVSHEGKLSHWARDCNLWPVADNSTKAGPLLARASAPGACSLQR